MCWNEFDVRIEVKCLSSHIHIQTKNYSAISFHTFAFVNDIITIRVHLNPKKNVLINKCTRKCKKIIHFDVWEVKRTNERKRVLLLLSSTFILKILVYCQLLYSAIAKSYIWVSIKYKHHLLEQQFFYLSIYG